MYEKTYPDKRFSITLAFVEKHLPKGTNILDLGVKNPLGEIMKTQGYHIQNTEGEDLDEDLSALHTNQYDALTGFEIFEHLLNPYTVLKEIKCNKILLSVPLKLWFSKAYQSKTDPRDRHYHEFEAWQFQWLLEKTGWEIKDQIKFTHPVKKIGFRPILRWFTPRYYLVYAEKKQNP